MKITPVKLFTLVTGLCLSGYGVANPVVKERQNAFEQIEVLVDSVDDQLDSRYPNWPELVKVSSQLFAYSRSLSTLFPQGSHRDSSADTDIWSEPETFNRLMSKMDSGFEHLNQASIEENKAMARSALKQAESTCRACHRQYKSRW